MPFILWDFIVASNGFNAYSSANKWDELPPVMTGSTYLSCKISCGKISNNAFSTPEYEALYTGEPTITPSDFPIVLAISFILGLLKFAKSKSFITPNMILLITVNQKINHSVFLIVLSIPFFLIF